MRSKSTRQVRELFAYCITFNQIQSCCDYF
ncbi:hypothetical protein FDX19_19470 [Citrobacter sp. wls619]|nr:hypothetical protein FDX19_19470 [Citrobacter sp. wls619]